MGGYDTAGFPWQNQITALLSVLVGGVAMGLVYLLAMKLFRVEEFGSLIGPLKARLGR